MIGMVSRGIKGIVSGCLNGLVSRFIKGLVSGRINTKGLVAGDL